MPVLSSDALRKTVSDALDMGPPLVGVGTRAFLRLGPGLFLRGYRILCCRRTEDLHAIRAMVPVECLEERDPAKGLPCRDTLSLLCHPLLRDEGLVPKRGAALVVYQENEGLRRLADQRDWKLLANPFRMRMRWEHKARFRARLQEAGFRVPRGTLISLEDLSRANCRTWRREWGRLVFQIPDFPRGGGRATFYVEHEDEFEQLRRGWEGGHHLGHTFGQVLVSSRIEGPSLSMEGCVTPWGVLLSPLQTQILDLKEVLPPGGSGRFCGHQWGDQAYSPEVEKTAERLVAWVGERLGSEGYRGLFGVDFALDSARGQLFALECNPRYTAAFPTLTLLQLSLGLPPLEAFHLLPWLEVKKAPPMGDLNRTYKMMPPVSQLCLFHRGEGSVHVRGDLQAGRYRWDDDMEAATKVGTWLPVPLPPWDPLEFLLLDGPPPRGSALLPGRELDPVLRVIFFRHICREDGTLDAFAALVVSWIYRSLGIGDD